MILLALALTISSGSAPPASSQTNPAADGAAAGSIAGTATPNTSQETQP